MIPEEQLKDLGFMKIRDRLYVKNGGHISLYRDYRGEKAISYAYSNGERIDPKQFKEHHAIMKIERDLLRVQLVKIN